MLIFTEMGGGLTTFFTSYTHINVSVKINGADNDVNFVETMIISPSETVIGKPITID
jgi:hypothetical protein